MVDITLNNETVSKKLPTVELLRQMETDDLEGSEPGGEGIVFGDSGSKLYVVDNGDNVNQYDLSTPYDISTHSHAGFHSVESEEPNPTAIRFRPNGEKLFVAGTTNHEVVEYDLSTAWDITSASYNNNSYNPSGIRNIYGMDFNDAGDKMVLSESGDTIYEYDLSTAWDVTTATSVGSSSISEVTSIRAIKYYNDGDNALLQNNTRTTYLLDLDSSYEFGSYNITSTLQHSKFFGIGYIAGFNGDGTELTYVYPGGPPDFVFTVELKNPYLFDGEEVPDGEIWDVNITGETIQINGAFIGDGSVDAILRAGQSFQAESGVLTGFKIKQE